MRTCGFWKFKLRTCGCGLFLILVRNFASFIQMLKFLSIFVKYSCFYPVKHEKSIKFFRVQVWQKYQVFQIQSDKKLSLLFDLIAFFMLTSCFFQFGKNNQFFSSLSSNLQAGSKYQYGFVVFNCEFTKLATSASFFVLVTSKDGSTIRYVQNLRTAKRTSHREPYRTSVSYFCSIFEVYRINVPYPYHYKKANRTNVPYLRKIETYCTVFAYRTVLPFLLLTTRNFN